MKKVQIISNCICYGPAPRLNSEIEQRLTINDKGQVWFSRYRYGNGEVRYPLIGKEYMRISKDDAEEILNLAAEMTTLGDDLFVTDTGEWEMIVTDSDSFTTRKAGPLIRTNSEPQQKFCNIIRKTLNRKGLFLLDGNWEYEACN